MVLGTYLLFGSLDLWVHADSRDLLITYSWAISPTFDCGRATILGLSAP